MEICDNRRRPYQMDAGDVEFGECFYHDQDVYMQTTKWTSSEFFGFAVNVRSGALKQFDRGCIVVPLKTRLIIEDE